MSDKTIDLTEERLDALIQGADPEPTEERLAAVVRELRAAQVETPARLRARVRESAAAPLKQRWSLPAWRRPLLVLAPLSAAVLLAVVVVDNQQGIGDTGGEAMISQTEESAADSLEAAPPGRSGILSTPALPSPDPSRPQDLNATLAVEVDSVEELSEGTISAMSTARRLGGHLVDAQYRAGQEEGVSQMTLAVPTARVDEALVSFGSLGTIIEQNVSIADLGDEVESLAERIVRARAEVTRLEQESREDPDNEAVKAQLEEARRTLTQLLADRGQVEETARMAQVSLTLAVQVEAPPEPGSFEQAVKDAGSDLEQVLSVGLHLLIVLSPLLVLLAVLAVLRTRFNRRRDRALFDRS